LQAAGYEVAASSGQVAITKRIISFKPHVIIADFQRSHDASPHSALIEPVPLICLVAKECQEERILAYRSGADAVVTKPVDVEELLALVNRMIRRLESPRLRAETAILAAQQTDDLTLAENALPSQ
jgi:DNA-binding response OmpR family regulator